jgi:uncharacterized caspase-like protein
MAIGTVTAHGAAAAEADQVALNLASEEPVVSGLALVAVQTSALTLAIGSVDVPRAVKARFRIPMVQMSITSVEASARGRALAHTRTMRLTVRRWQVPGNRGDKRLGHCRATGRSLVAATSCCMSLSIGHLEAIGVLDP